MKQVEVTIGSKQVGLGFVVPYSHDHGLQYYTSALGTRQRAVVYRLPVYEVRVAHGSTYSAIRFGLRNLDKPPTASRDCDTGLSHQRICTPTWVPGYSPHSFPGKSRPGAWRLLPGKGFLIHEGADTSKGQVGGSLGCIEILDGRWNDFLDEIEKLGDGPCSRLGAATKVIVTIEAASYPTANLVP